LGTKYGHEFLSGVDASMYKHSCVLHVDIFGRKLYSCLFGICMLLRPVQVGSEKKWVEKYQFRVEKVEINGPGDPLRLPRDILSKS
jgi:hypothetical protein